MSESHARLLAESRRAAAEAIDAAQELFCQCFTDDMEYGYCIKHAIIDPLTPIVAALEAAAA